MNSPFVQGALFHRACPLKGQSYSHFCIFFIDKLHFIDKCGGLIIRVHTAYRIGSLGSFGVYAQNVVVKPYNWRFNGFIFDLNKFLHKILSIYQNQYVQILHILPLMAKITPLNFTIRRLKIMIRKRQVFCKCSIKC